MGEAAFDLFFCYLKLGDPEAAKRVAAETVGPLAEEFRMKKWDTPSDRLLQAGFHFVSGELASKSGEHQRAREFCQRGISRLEENLRIRSYPGEGILWFSINQIRQRVGARRGDKVRNGVCQ